jgi:hypothetical protein
MKQIPLVLLAVGAAVLTGCVVTSVYPFYTEEDLVSEPGLVGNWIKTGEDADNEVWKFEKGRDLAYRFTLIESRKATVMEVHAFKLRGQLFLDVFSTEQDFHVIPPHYLLKVSQLTPTLRMSELNDEWLNELLLKNPGALRHERVKTGDQPEDRRIVLVAETLELQKFVIQHLKTEGAWTDFELEREHSAAHVH